MVQVSSTFVLININSTILLFTLYSAVVDSKTKDDNELNDGVLINSTVMESLSGLASSPLD